ncbi:transglutaminase domain-containing protein [Streptomyces chartreusis]|uniref:transglutaminase domain-containing protein n=1 Tax=Streptomyces chartreusis TaxID=1969 RepID=UPI0033A79A96
MPTDRTPPRQRVDTVPAGAAVTALLDRLGRIPSQRRDFRIGEREALSRYGLAPTLLHPLLELGFPARTEDGAYSYDAADLVNLSLQLRRGALSRALTRFWPRALSALTGPGPAGYRVGHQAACPEPDRPGHNACEFTVLTPEGERTVQRPVRADPGPVLETELWLRTDWPDLPPPMAGVVAEVADLEFMWLPRSLRWDTAFMRRTGLADCMGVSRLLVEEARARGLPARTAYGLVVAPPYATHHYWAEAGVGGDWVPLDPLMIKAMLGWGVLDHREWHPARSLGGMLCRLAADRTPVVTHDGVPCASSYPTRGLTPTPAQDTGAHHSGAPDDNKEDRA